MHLSLNKMTALRILRQQRSKHGHTGIPLFRTCIAEPNPAPASRWTMDLIDLSEFEQAGLYSASRPLEVAVPHASNRLRIKTARNTVYEQGIPEESFIDLKNGLSISSPELLFVETAPLMPTATHVLLGYELCGTFSRDSMEPRNGNVVFGCPAVTTVNDIQSFISACHNIRGLKKAEEHLAFVANNAWAPTESVIATLLQLPIWEFGYGLPGVKLNKRVGLSGHGQVPPFAASRVPDIVIDGSPVGINYDGSDHMDLESISIAAKNAAMNSTDQSAQRELSDVLKAVRAKIVDDKRRDRELGSKGLFVMPVTKEDLYELGRFEQLVHLLLDGIETRTGQNMSQQRAYLSNPKLQAKRQQLVWSLLPGRRGMSIALTLQEKNMRRMRA